MEPERLLDLIDSYFGGSDGRTRHPFNRRFIYSDGVKAAADLVGAYWLLDIVATEVVPVCLARWENEGDGLSFFEVIVADDKADLRLVRDSGEQPLWQRHIDFTTFPEGRWVFYLGIDGVIEHPNEVLCMYLPSEH